MKSKNIIRITFITAFILLIPLALTYLNPNAHLNRGNGGGWDWSPGDFLVMGALIFGAGFVFELVASRGKNITYRAGIAVAVLVSLLLVWVNAAVGIIGDENPANFMYPAVVLLGLIGLWISKLKTDNLVRLDFTIALLLMLVPTIALFVWTPEAYSWSPGVLEVFALNAGFAAFYIFSAILLRKANTA